MHTIDVSKGSMNTAVSSQWMSRPDDQKFLSLTDLRAQVAAWADDSIELDLEPRAVSVNPVSNDEMTVIADGHEVNLSHYAFQSICTEARVPAEYLRKLPAPLAALNLNYGLRSVLQRERELYVRKGDQPMLRGITSPRYGRILDREVVDAVMNVAGNGTGDTDWKVPGVIDWQSKHGVAYNPHVDITKQTTTLFASDRDVFLFLVDDTHPIEVGKLANGDPDLMFRGFYVWNSEVGGKSFGVATMYLRGVCQNRCLWGVEGFSETSFAHTAGAPERFKVETAPALESFASGNTAKLIEGVKTAKAAVVSKTDEDRIEFLQKLGFSAKQAGELVNVAIAEEGKAPETAWDHAQAITASARMVGHQDKRIAMEAVAGKLLDKVTA